MDRDNFYNRVYEKAEAVYGSLFSETVKKRLEWELSYANQKKLQQMFENAANITANFPLGEWTARSTAGCSMIAYVLGITDINPFQFNLQPEFFFLPESDVKPSIEIDVSYSQFADIPDGIGIYKMPEHWEYSEYVPDVKIMKNRYCELLHELSSITNAQAGKVNLDDEGLREYFGTLEKNNDELKFFTLYLLGGNPDGNMAEDMIRCLHPQTFDEYVKIYSIAHGTGTWEGMPKDIVQAGMIRIKDFIATRDDVYDFLVQSGLEHEISVKYAKYIQMGHGINDELEALLIERNVEEWKILSLDGIGYLWSRSHGIAYMKMIWRLVYYRIYYRDTFDKCMEKIK